MKSRQAFSLLEVILALAILGCAVAVIGETMRLGMRTAELSRDDTCAQLLGESRLAEIASGIAPAEPVVDEVLDPEGRWLHTVEIERTDDQSLMAVRISVRPANSSDPARQFSLFRWMADPQIEYADRQVQEERETAEDDRISQSKEAQENANSAAGAGGQGSNAAATGAGGGGGLLPGNVRGFGGAGQGQGQGQGDGGRNGPPGSGPPGFGPRGPGGPGGQGRGGGPRGGGPPGNGPGGPNGPGGNGPGGGGRGGPGGNPGGQGRPSPNFQPGGPGNSGPGNFAPGNFAPGGGPAGGPQQPGGGGFGGARGS